MTFDSDGDHTASAIVLADCYLEVRNFRRAEEVLRAALANNPHDAALLNELARTQHLSGDHHAAERTVRDALNRTPEDACPMRIYASVLDALDRQGEGLSWARRAVEAAPLDSMTHFEYARLLVSAGDAEAALPVVTEALRLAPDDADTHDLMGVVLGMVGRLAESTSEHEMALRLEPGHAQALHNIAVNRAHSRKLFSAIVGFRQAAQLDPHLGEKVRANIAATIRAWLCWTTLAAWLALWILFRVERTGATERVGRVVAGVGCVVLLVMFGRLARSLPRHLWPVVLRQPGYRSPRIYLGLCVSVVGVLGAFALGAPVNQLVLAVTLLLAVVVSWVAPRLDKEWLDGVRSEIQ